MDMSGEQIVATGPIERRTVWGRVWRTALTLIILSGVFAPFLFLHVLQSVLGYRLLGQDVLAKGESTLVIPEDYTRGYLKVEVRLQEEIANGGLSRELEKSIGVDYGLTIDGEMTTASGTLSYGGYNSRGKQGTSIWFTVYPTSDPENPDAKRSDAWITIDEDEVLTRPLEIDFWRGH